MKKALTFGLLSFTIGVQAITVEMPIGHSRPSFASGEGHSSYTYTPNRQAPPESGAFEYQGVWYAPYVGEHSELSGTLMAVEPQDRQT